MEYAQPARISTHLWAPLPHLWTPLPHLWTPLPTPGRPDPACYLIALGIADSNPLVTPSTHPPTHPP
eukprot:364797-Chlamydomonas_euryale.AAC.2